MEEFCYWHENAPVTIPLYQNKICLLRQTEYRIETEVGIKNKTNIFCPYETKEQAILNCPEYKVMERLNEEYSKQKN